MHGQGTFTTVQGDVYRGTFKGDMMNGTGRFEYSDGDIGTAVTLYSQMWDMDDVSVSDPSDNVSDTTADAGGASADLVKPVRIDDL